MFNNYKYVSIIMRKSLLKLSFVAGLAFLFSGSEAWAIDGLRYRGEAQVSFSSGQNTPFWLVSNKMGLSSIKKNNGYIRMGVFRDMDEDRKFSWGAGVDLVGAYNFTSSFVIQQLYGEIKYRCLGAMVGSKEIYGEFNNPRLSSGNMLYSGNARPIPQVRVGIPEFTVIPYTKNWLAIKGYVAYGMFTDDGWQRDFAAPGSKRTEHVLYHSKGLFLRVGDVARHPWAVEGGLEMAAQFGGKSYIGDKVIDMPNGIKDWFKVFFPQGGDSSTPMGEQTNVYGNHVGTWSLGVTYNPTPDWGFRAYYQHFFEDHSQLFFDYEWKDGFWGIEVSFPKNPVIGKFVYEYLYTKDQSGAVYNDTSASIPEQVSGIDNYYNHGIYTGWQHWGMGIGNPLIVSPIYNNGQIYFRSNRLIGHHVGFEGQPLEELGYRVLCSFTRNWGIYSNPLPEVENFYSGMLEVTYTPKWLEGSAGILSIGADRGALLGNSFGVMFTFRKSGIL